MHLANLHITTLTFVIEFSITKPCYQKNELNFLTYLLKNLTYTTLHSIVIPMKALRLLGIKLNIQLFILQYTQFLIKNPENVVIITSTLLIAPYFIYYLKNLDT